MLGFHLTPQSQTTSEITDKIWNIVVKQGLEENYGEYWDKTQILREFNKYGCISQKFLKTQITSNFLCPSYKPGTLNHNS